MLGPAIAFHGATLAPFGGIFRFERGIPRAVSKKEDILNVECDRSEAPGMKRREFIRMTSYGAAGTAALSGVTTDWFGLYGNPTVNPGTNGDQVINRINFILFICLD